ncbi:MAG: recombination protein O N-terminal domain-containing protein, partial [Bacteroidales bacterium]|nr:recombination protein O N-terminal domain-containing protein [Bacteroidales bacterium]
MLVCTEGIILHKTKYSDHSLIVQIYTEKFGTQSFIIKNALSKANKN